jgi:perosamine synthetase
MGRQICNCRAKAGDPMKSRIHYTKPSITELEVSYATDAARNGWGERCYEYISRFELLFSAHLGVKHAIATSSCTGAIHMGLAALGIGQGDEVILADINWIATASPITYLGAKPVLVDVLPDTWCIDPARVEAAITPLTRAIIAVHLYGNLCDMESLLAIGAKHGIPVIEDAAEAIGSQWHDQRTGSIGAFGAFSFHGTKTLTTGEGGMIVTNDLDIYEKLLTLSNHGRSRSQTKQFWPDMVGFKYKMSNIQAAVGCAQMARIDELISRKRQIFALYTEGLKSVSDKILMNPELPGMVNGYWMPTIVARPGVAFDRQRLLDVFKSESIDGRVFFWPLSSLGLKQLSVIEGSTPVAYSLCKRAVNLPSYHEMSGDDIKRVVDIVKMELHKREIA